MLTQQRPGYEETGLRVSSVLRMHRLMTISTSLIQRELDILSSEMQTEIDEKLRRLLSLD